MTIHPLIAFFIILFLLTKVEQYFYYEKCKIEDFKSKWGIKTLFGVIASASVIMRFWSGDYFLGAPIHVASLILLIPGLAAVRGARTFLEAGELATKTSAPAIKLKTREIFLDALLCFIIPEYFILSYLKLHSYKNNLYNVPALGAEGDTDQKLNIHICFLYGICMALSGFCKNNFYEMFFAMATGLIAVYYFVPGKEKLSYDWQFLNKLKYINYCARSQLNWSGPLLSRKTLENIQSFGSTMVVLIELFFPLLLIPAVVPGLTCLYAVIGILIGFHIFVFIFTGINFWKWALTLVCVVLLLEKLDYQNYNNDLIYSFIFASSFGYGYLVSKMLIGLGWLDSPLNRVYKIYFKYVGDDKLYRLRPHNLYPWDIILSQNRLGFLFPEKKSITGCLGAIRDVPTYKYLNHVSENENDVEKIRQSVMSIIQQKGHVQSESLLHTFLHFVIGVSEKKRKQQTKIECALDRVFIHIRDRKEKNDYDMKDAPISAPIEKVVIRFERNFFSDKLNKLIRLEQEERVVKIGHV